MSCITMAYFTCICFICTHICLSVQQCLMQACVCMLQNKCECLRCGFAVVVKALASQLHRIDHHIFPTHRNIMQCSSRLWLAQGREELWRSYFAATQGQVALHQAYTITYLCIQSVKYALKSKVSLKKRSGEHSVKLFFKSGLYYPQS